MIVFFDARKLHQLYFIHDLDEATSLLIYLDNQCHFPTGIFTDSYNVIANAPLSSLFIETSLDATPFHLNFTDTVSNTGTKTTTPFSILRFPYNNSMAHLNDTLIFILRTTSIHARESDKVLHR